MRPTDSSAQSVARGSPRLNQARKASSIIDVSLSGLEPPLAIVYSPDSHPAPSGA
jgi:hypothetical protein